MAKIDPAEFAIAKSMHAQAAREAPKEKQQIRRRQAAIAKHMHAQGSIKAEGIGQKIGGVDPRLYFRLDQENPGCFRDPTYVQEFLRDNPQCRAPGYKAQGSYRATSRYLGEGRWQKVI